MQPEKLTLANLGAGGLEEDFARAVKQLCENVADPNVPTDAVRSITISIKVKPDKRGQSAGLAYSVKTNLPGAEPGEAAAWIAMDKENRLGLFRMDMRQESLPLNEPTVTEIKPVSDAVRGAAMPKPKFAGPTPEA